MQNQRTPLASQQPNPSHWTQTATVGLLLVLVWQKLAKLAALLLLIALVALGARSLHINIVGVGIAVLVTMVLVFRSRR